MLDLWILQVDRYSENILDFLFHGFEYWIVLLEMSSGRFEEHTSGQVLRIKALFPAFSVMRMEGENLGKSVR
jgi:hypothetical protein